MIIRGLQVDETDILDEHDGFALTVADLIEHVREQAMHSGNIVHVEWNLTVETPKQAGTILVVYNGVVWPGVYSPARQMVLLYPEDYSPVAFADCDYWADLPERPYLP